MGQGGRPVLNSKSDALVLVERVRFNGRFMRCPLEIANALVSIKDTRR
jgi:hypothetical protein